ncbi:MAG: chromosome segregation protein SMC, partial [Oscillospiraceae bacterium]|nr:chromosome segregation protein SMC [Oscillospiraceae bacterium]
MFLKRIEIYGFKSFADKTALDFDSGITAIVGPNGSGKSNISDSVRWVLGEMSARSLRGLNMQDIIFSGTEKRKQLNFAEVTLVLDNNDKAFDIEFDEVTVTRRVFRSGESTYLINKTQCRLRDITELFLDTGLGREGYSIIGQGRVDRILSTKAEDRRSIFEEAAGISKYKQRKEDAEKKLKSVEENLVRIDDIVSELEKQLSPLEKQAEKAKEYFVLYDEHKKLDVSISYLSIKNSKKSLDETERFYTDILNQRTELEKNGSELEIELSALYNDIKLQDDKSREENEILSKNRDEKMSAENTVNLLKNDIQNNIAISGRIEKDKENALAKINDIHAKTDELERKAAAAEEYKRTVNAGLAELEENAARTDDILREKQNIINGIKSDIISLMNDASAAKAKLSGIENLRRNFLDRRETVEKEISGFNESMEKKNRDIENNRRLVAQKEEKLAEMKERLGRFEKRYAENREKINNITAQINRLTVDYNSKNSRKRMLEDMELSYDGFSGSVKAVLTSKELGECSIYGTVSSLIQVKSEYITAVETAFGGGMQNIVVEDEEDAKEEIAFLKRTKSGRATFLPVSSVRAMGSSFPDLSGEPGYIGIAAELVSCNIKYREIIKSMLGRIAVTDNIDNAVSISRKYGYKFRIVTLEGDVV